MDTIENTLVVNYTAIFADIESQCKQKKKDTFTALEDIGISAIRLANYIKQFPHIYDASEYPKSDILAAIPIDVFYKLCNSFGLNQSKYTVLTIQEQKESDALVLKDFMAILGIKSEPAPELTDDDIETNAETNISNDIDDKADTKIDTKANIVANVQSNVKTNTLKVLDTNSKPIKSSTPMPTNRCGGVMRDPITGRFLKKNKSIEKPDNIDINITDIKDIITMKDSTKLISSNITSIQKNKKQTYIRDEILMVLPKLNTEELNTVIAECIRLYINKEVYNRLNKESK